MQDIRKTIEPLKTALQNLVYGKTDVVNSRGFCGMIKKEIPATYTMNVNMTFEGGEGEPRFSITITCDAAGMAYGKTFRARDLATAVEKAMTPLKESGHTLQALAS